MRVIFNLKDGVSVEHQDVDRVVSDGKKRKSFSFTVKLRLPLFLARWSSTLIFRWAEARPPAQTDTHPRAGGF